MFAMPQWLPDSLAAVDMEPLESTMNVHRPFLDLTVRDSQLTGAGRVPIAVPDLRGYKTGPRAAIEAIRPNVDAARPALDIALRLDLPLQGELLEILDQQVPERRGAIELPLIRAREFSGRAMVSADHIATGMRAQLPLHMLALQPKLAATALVPAGLRILPANQLLTAQGAGAGDGLRAIDLRTSQEPPQFVLSTPPCRPRLSLAAGSRYRVATKKSELGLAAAEPEALAPFSSGPPPISLPERKTTVMAAARTTAPVEKAAEKAAVGKITVPAPVVEATFEPAIDPAFEPAPTGLLPLTCNNQPSVGALEIHPVPAALTLPQPLGTKAMWPKLKLEPLDSKPTSDAIAASQPMKPPAPSLHARSRGPVWAHAVDFWNRAPRDLKMLVFAIPILLGLALNPALPKVRMAAPAAANGIQRNVQRAFNDQWVNVKQTMTDRAAVALDEDFRSGLDDWSTRTDATAEWSFDATGFVRPGSLALYRPSMGLTDYQMQFLGVIDKQALSWVIRAADFDNFYVVKLVVLKAGPLPTIGVTRYAVVNGKAEDRVDTLAPLDARADMLYRVRMDVRGDDYTLSVQGQMVDSWTEPRLRHGGIGFFSARGEQSRLRWVQITHQYDMLGRLCAYLAPYNIPAAGGSWQP
jgi:hypothetical protein